VALSWSSKHIPSTDLPMASLFCEKEPVKADRVPISKNAIAVLRRRYLKKDSLGRVVETPAQMFKRVAQNLAEAENFYSTKANPEQVAESFYGLMSRLEFLPNSPTLMNAGRELQQLAACFVLPVEDSLESIFEAVKYTALIHQSGGGTGFSFSHLRPKNDPVLSTSGIASGPVSFMKVFNSATEVIKQGGTRRGANMGILRVDHPDILEFITVKEDPNELVNFNLSVGMTDDFIRAVQADEAYPLINPRTRRVAGSLKAREVFEKIVRAAWKTGEPGILFLDRINRDNPTPQLGAMEATNPCGEQPLLPYEPCNLGSINLSRMVKRKGKGFEMDYGKLDHTIRLSIRFLDNVIDMNRHPLPQIEVMAKQNRKIGLGVMGLADLLILLEIPYDAHDAIVLAEKLMAYIQEVAWRASEELAGERGVFPNFDQSIWAKQGRHMRNATTTTIAPTGTLSVIAGASSGIEPLYGISYTRTAMDDLKLIEVYPLFIKAAKRAGFYNRKLLSTIKTDGSIRSIHAIPEEIRRLFVTAHDISPKAHIQMQAAFQRHTDNAVSKTVNFPHNASPQQVKEAFFLAYKNGCKGVTIYRSGSRNQQVLTCVSGNIGYC
jgi:ribonucleoside-diphosphate reductase alpha chain